MLSTRLVKMTGLPALLQTNLLSDAFIAADSRQRNSASSDQDNDDDSGKRLHRGQGVVPAVPKLKNALASIARAPTSDKMQPVERTSLRKLECNATFRRVRFDRAAT